MAQRFRVSSDGTFVAMGGALFGWQAPAQLIAPVFRSAEEAYGAAGATLTVSLPEGVVEGDLLLAVWACNNNNGGVTFPGDWNVIHTLNGGSGQLDGQLAYKVATSSEPSSWNFPVTGASSRVVIAAFRNTSGIDVSAAHIDTGTTVDMPSTTASEGQSLAVSVYAANTTYPEPPEEWSVDYVQAPGFVAVAFASESLDYPGEVAHAWTHSGGAASIYNLVLSGVDEDAYVPGNPPVANDYGPMNTVDRAPRPGTAGTPGTFYVAPTGGVASGAGGVGAPWTLEHALGAAVIPAGSTILLRGGTYTGPFTCSKNDITVQSYPGEWAVIDFPTESASYTTILEFRGDNVTVRWLEVTCSALTRYFSPDHVGRPPGVTIYGEECTIAHVLITDVGGGLGWWQPAEGGVIEHCLVLDQGWDGVVRTHGHGIYTQNWQVNDSKVLRHNVFANDASTGIKTGGSSAEISNFDIDGNTIVGTGTHDYPDHPYASGPAIQHYSYHRSSKGMVYRRNRVYVPGLSWTSWGTADYPHRDFELSGNWFYSVSDHAVTWRNEIESMALTDNTITSSTSVVIEAFGTLAPTERYYSNNHYYSPTTLPLSPNGVASTFNSWVTTTDDAGSELLSGDPDPQQWVNPSPHEDGCALVTVWNPNEDEEVTVDCSSAGIAEGESWWLFNATNPKAGPVATGTGPGVVVPMTLAVAGPCRTPAGLDPAPSTLPRFGVFVVRQLATWVAPA